MAAMMLTLHPNSTPRFSRYQVPRLNEAYSQGNEQALRDVLDEWNNSPETVKAGREPLHPHEPLKAVSWSVIGSLDCEIGFERYNSQAASTIESMGF